MLEMTRDSAQIKKINQLKRLPSVAKTTRYFNFLDNRYINFLENASGNY